MKKSILLSVIFFCFITSAFAFSDVNSSTRHRKGVEFVQNKGIVNGYADGTFRPNQSINRAELLKIIVESKFSKAAIQDCIPDNIQRLSEVFFKDVLGDKWYSPYVCLAKVNGIIKGYSDGAFRPDQPISFVEALKITAKVYGISFAEGNVWYEDLVRKASENTNLIPLTISDFNQQMTRGEMADMVSRFYQHEKGELENYLGDEKDIKVTYEAIQRKENMDANFSLFQGNQNNNTSSVLKVSQGNLAKKNPVFIGDKDVELLPLAFEAKGDTITVQKIEIHLAADKDTDFKIKLLSGIYDGDVSPSIIQSGSLYDENGKKIAGPLERNGYVFEFQNLNYKIPDGEKKTLLLKVDLVKAMGEPEVYIAASLVRPRPETDHFLAPRDLFITGDKSNPGIQSEKTINYAETPENWVKISKKSASDAAKKTYDGALQCGGKTCGPLDICVSNQCVRAPMTLAFINGGFDQDYFEFMIEKGITYLEKLTPLKECPGQIRVHRIYACCADEPRIEKCAAKYISGFDPSIISVYLHPKDKSQCNAMSVTGSNSMEVIDCDSAFVHETGHALGLADQYCLDAKFNNKPAVNPVSDSQGCGYSPAKREYTCPAPGVCWNRKTNESDRNNLDRVWCKSNKECEDKYGSGDWECNSCFIPKKDTWEYNYCSAHRDPPVFCLGSLTGNKNRSLMGGDLPVEFDENEYAILKEKLQCR